MTQRAPCSAFFYQWTYDIFLNFRGEDTRSGFTGYLYSALCENGIHTFIDDEELRKGEEITPALLKAIEESRMAIIVFSINYASSTYCLEELVKILESIKGKGRWVYPIFYQVSPSDVRHQRGNYEEALAKHEKRFVNNLKKVQKWRQALSEAANLSGWHYQQGYEYEFIRNIVEEVSNKFNRNPLHVANCPVGLESRVHEVNSILDVGSNTGVNMVGIWGIGGIGKTTIACAVYNSIADQFEGLCFLADIRENAMKHGLAKLQERLLSDLAAGEKNFEFDTVRKGIPIIKNKLHKKKILLILDDVDKLEQLQAIVGGLDWFGLGSKIIITTRNKHLLDIHGVRKKYEVLGLNHQEALELFCWNAFKTNEILDSSYKETTNRAVLYCNGLPLALEIIGSNLFGRRLDQWKSALDTYEEIPNKNIQEILRVSFEGLEEKEQMIFLDMACFFTGHSLKEVTNILLSGRGFNPTFVIQVLIDKGLMNIDESFVNMHDLIKDMGREIVRQESPSKPGRRSRLWFYEDILRILEDDTGTENVEFIMLQLPKSKEVSWKGNELKKMKNLRMLIISENSRFSTLPKHLPKSLRVLKWPRYPASCLPSNFDPQNVVMFDMSNSSLQLDKPIMILFCRSSGLLSYLNLSSCECLKRIPNINGAPNLRELYLDYCKNLTEVHDSIGFLDKLELLSARECTELKILPHCFKLTSLRTLYLGGCSSLQSFPEISSEMKNVTDVDLQGCGIQDLPFSFSNLVGLNFLQLDGCNKLYWLPSSIFLLPNLRGLSASSCKGFENFYSFGKGEERERVGSLVSSDLRSVDLRLSHLTDRLLTSYLPCFLKVQTLTLSDTKITILPAEFDKCHFLCVLSVNGCKQLREIRGIPPNIKDFRALDCTSLTCQAQSTLLSEAIHKNGDTYFLLPGSRIPRWFDYTKRGPYLSFWFRKKFPAIALCFVFESTDKLGTLYFRVRINGIQIYYGKCYSLKIRKIDHIILSDMQFLVPNDKLQRLYVEEEWNHVEVSYNKSQRDSLDGIMKWMGVHVYKKKTSMQDVRFTNASPSNHFWDFSNELNLNWYQLQEKNCASQGMEICEASDIQLQLHSYGCWLESPQQTCDGPQNYNPDLDLNCYSFNKIHRGKGTNMYIENWYPYWDKYPDLWQKQFCEMQKQQVDGDCDDEPLYTACWEIINKTEIVEDVAKLLLSICQRSLPTYEYLFSRKLVNSSICPICGLEPETIEHVFLFCPWTQPFWFASDFQWSMDVNSVQSFQGWFLEKHEEIKRVHQNVYKILALVGKICWAIWKARNEFVLEDKPIDPWRVFINLS